MRKPIFWRCYFLFLSSFFVTSRHPVVLPHQGEVRGCVLQGPSRRILQNSPGNQVWYSLPEGLWAARLFPVDLPIKQTVVRQGHLQAWVVQPHVGPQGQLGPESFSLRAFYWMFCGLWWEKLPLWAKHRGGGFLRYWGSDMIPFRGKDVISCWGKRRE